jgi:hypothetical protein
MADRSYNLTGQGYAVDRTLRGRIDKTGCAGHRLHHHYTISAFNALDTMHDLDYPGATCQALGHIVTTRH